MLIDISENTRINIAYRKFAQSSKIDQQKKLNHSMKTERYLLNFSH